MTDIRKTKINPDFQRVVTFYKSFAKPGSGYSVKVVEDSNNALFLEIKETAKSPEKLKANKKALQDKPGIPLELYKPTSPVDLDYDSQRIATFTKNFAKKGSGCSLKIIKDKDTDDLFLEVKATAKSPEKLKANKKALLGGPGIPIESKTPPDLG